MKEDDFKKMTDSELWQLCLRNPRKGLSLVFKKHTYNLTIYIERKYHLGPEASKDLAQDVFMVLIEKFKLKQAPQEMNNLWGYLTHIAFYTYANQVRRDKTKEKYLKALEYGGNKWTDSIAEAELYIERIERCIDMIQDERKRKILRLTIQGFKVNEIAKKLKMRPRQVSKLKHKAKKELAEKLNM